MTDSFGQKKRIHLINDEKREREKKIRNRINKSPFLKQMMMSLHSTGSMSLSDPTDALPANHASPGSQSRDRMQNGT